MRYALPNNYGTAQAKTVFERSMTTSTNICSLRMGQGGQILQNAIYSPDNRLWLN